MNRKQRRSTFERPARQAAGKTVCAAAFTEALAAYRRNDLVSAEVGFRQVLRLQPQHAEALHLLGVVFYRTGRMTEAAESMGASVELCGSNSSYRSNLGLVLHALGRLDEAAAQHREALRLNPNHAEAHNNLGNVLQLQGKLDEAAMHYVEALRLKPDYADPYINLGAVAKAQGRVEEAIAHYRKALLLQPHHASTHYNLGNALTSEGKLPEAVAAFRHAVTYDPASAKAHYNLGNALASQDRSNEAMAEFQQALRLDPACAEAYANMGAIHHGAARWSEAAHCYERALAIRPTEAKAHLNLGMVHLVKGDLPAGWPHYEYRHEAVPESAPRVFSQFQWRGEPLSGRRILIHPEQGLGDTLQFLRYVPMVQALGGRVVLLVQPSLRRLAAALPGEVEVVYDDASLPPFDLQCPMLSLPLAFGTTMETIPAKVPYLFVPQHDLAHATARSWPASGLRVGLVWGGNPTQGRDRFRSMPLAACEPILRVEGVHFYSLQVGPPAAQLRALDLPGVSVEDLQPSLENMADTAAKILQLDLVITVCTSVAHLAGALGVPTWVMLCYSADWRWFLDRADSPWYPTAQLFRQPKIGDWAAVADDVAKSLLELRTSGQMPTHRQTLELSLP